MTGHYWDTRYTCHSVLYTAGWIFISRFRWRYFNLGLTHDRTLTGDWAGPAEEMPGGGGSSRGEGRCWVINVVSVGCSCSPCFWQDEHLLVSPTDLPHVLSFKGPLSRIERLVSIYYVLRPTFSLTFAFYYVFSFFFFSFSSLLLPLIITIFGSWSLCSDIWLLIVIFWGPSSHWYLALNHCLLRPTFPLTIGFYLSCFEANLFTD